MSGTSTNSSNTSNFCLFDSLVRLRAELACRGNVCSPKHFSLNDTEVWRVNCAKSPQCLGLYGTEKRGKMKSPAALLTNEYRIVYVSEAEQTAHTKLPGGTSYSVPNNFFLFSIHFRVGTKQLRG